MRRKDREEEGERERRKERGSNGLRATEGGRERGSGGRKGKGNGKRRTIDTEGGNEGERRVDGSGNQGGDGKEENSEVLCWYPKRQYSNKKTVPISLTSLIKRFKRLHNFMFYYFCFVL